MCKYSSLNDLVNATEEELTVAYLPIGLNRQRAKSTLNLAKYLIEKEQGMIPDSLERLISTPGFGAYSARAVMSFGFGIPAAIVDSNVIRVVSRMFQMSLSSKVHVSIIQRVADDLLPHESHRDFNLGLLDLGAVVCRYDSPRCSDCPLLHCCDYAKDGPADYDQSGSQNNVKRIRTDQGVTLTDLAKRSRLSKHTIAKIESEESRPRRIICKRSGTHWV